MNVLFTLMKSDIHLFWRRREKKSYLGRQREKMPRHRELMKTGRVRTPHTYVSNTWHFAQRIHTLEMNVFRCWSTFIAKTKAVRVALPHFSSILLLTYLDEHSFTLFICKIAIVHSGSEFNTTFRKKGLLHTAATECHYSSIWKRQQQLPS